MNFNLYTSNKKDIIKSGKFLSKILIPGFIFFLIGNIGIGKTFFIKCLIGFETKYKYIIKSPTFLLIEEYLIFDFLMYHLDLYNVYKKKIFFETEILNCYKKNSILLIEWGNIIKNIIKSNVNIYFSNFSNFSNRIILIKIHLLSFKKILGINK